MRLFIFIFLCGFGMSVSCTKTYFSNVLTTLEGVELTAENCKLENISYLNLRNDTGFQYRGLEVLIHDTLQNDLKAHYLIAQIIEEDLLSSRKRQNLFRQIDGLRKSIKTLINKQIRLLQMSIQKEQELSRLDSLPEKKEKLNEIFGLFEERKQTFQKIDHFMLEVVNLLRNSVHFPDNKEPAHGGLSEGFWQVLMDSRAVISETRDLESQNMLSILDHSSRISDFCRFLRDGYRLNNTGKELAGQIRELAEEFRLTRDQAYDITQSADYQTLDILGHNLLKLDSLLDSLQLRMETHKVWLDNVRKRYQLSSQILDLEKRVEEEGFSQ